MGGESLWDDPETLPSSRTSLRHVTAGSWPPTPGTGAQLPAAVTTSAVYPFLVPSFQRLGVISHVHCLLSRPRLRVCFGGPTKVGLFIFVSHRLSFPARSECTEAGPVLVLKSVPSVPAASCQEPQALQQGRLGTAQKWSVVTAATVDGGVRTRRCALCTCLVSDSERPQPHVH